MIRLFPVLIMLFLSSIPLRASEPIVKQIEIRGLVRIDEFSVRNKISQKISDPLNSNGVKDDIKNIYGMGYFDDVKVEMDFFEGGIKLIYVLREKPIISRVVFHGNDNFDDEKLKEQVTLSRGSIADENLINDNALNLKGFYESEGYWLAEVIPVVRRVRGSNAVVTYIIHEAEKIKILTIDIAGNDAIDDDDIKDEMKTSEWWLFSFLSGGGYYSSRVIREDIENIKNLYYDNGYLNVRVSEPEIKVITEKSTTKKADQENFWREGDYMDSGKDTWIDENYMLVKITVSEGRQYSVASVGIEGNKNFASEDVKKLIKLEEGEVFSKKIVTGDVKSITDYYSDRGYALASVDPGVKPLRGTDEVDVLYRIIEGDLFHIGRIDISGNTKTKDKVIRREIRLDEGDEYKGSLIKRSYQRLNNLNFFESIELRPRPRPEEKLLDLDIHVKDKSTGMISVGGGYSTTEQFIAMIDLTQANLFGSGRYLKFSGEFGGRTTTYDISYRDPWFLDTQLSMTIRLYQSIKDYFQYKREATGLGFGLSKPLTEYWNAGFSYNFESIDIYDIDDTASDTIKDQEGYSTTSSISPSIVRDSRDYFLDPHEGSRNVLSLKYAGLGGDNKYVKGVFDSSWFFPLGPTTFAVRGRYGYANGLSGEELPLYERFYVGGINTIRGLDWGDGGPKDDNGDAIGGEEEILFNVEYIFPLVPEARLKGLIFYDIGKAYNHGDPPLQDLRDSIGAGVRWISPIGPLRLEWGHVLDRRDGEDESKIEFTFGTFF